MCRSTFLFLIVFIRFLVLILKKWTFTKSWYISIWLSILFLWNCNKRFQHIFNLLSPWFDSIMFWHSIGKSKLVSQYKLSKVLHNPIDGCAIKRNLTNDRLFNLRLCIWHCDWLKVLIDLISYANCLYCDINHWKAGKQVNFYTNLCW